MAKETMDAHFLIRLTKDLLARATARAELDGRSLAGYIRHLIESDLRKHR